MSDKSQSKKFKDLAHEAECDEDEKAFDDKLKRITKAGSNSEEKSEESKKNKK